MEWRPPSVIRRVHFNTMFQEQPDNWSGTLHGRMERRTSFDVLSIDIGLILQEQNYHIFVSSHNCSVQWRLIGSRDFTWFKSITEEFFNSRKKSHVGCVE